MTTHMQFQKSTPTALFVAFSKEVRRIHELWLIWYRLFRDELAPHDSEVFDGAKRVWHHAFNSMAIDIVLSLCRIVDPDEMKGRSNLTVARIWKELGDFDGRENLRKAALGIMQHFRDAVDTGGLVRLRHRLIGHNDLAAVLGHESHPAGIEKIRHAVEALVTFQWRCESLFEARLVDYSTSGSAVHRTYELDTEIAAEVDNLMAKLRP